ncbi:hypothetical protein [Anaerobium acetethylicum]|nr:hypothetical protein [Anaerobium acetethylicum]
MKSLQGRENSAAVEQLTASCMPHEVMELGCLLNYDGDAYYEASLGRAGS